MNQNKTATGQQRSVVKGGSVKHTKAKAQRFENSFERRADSLEHTVAPRATAIPGIAHSRKKSRSELPMHHEEQKRASGNASTLASMVEGKAQAVAAAGGSYISDHETSASPVSIKRKRKVKQGTLTRAANAKTRDDRLNESPSTAASACDNKRRDPRISGLMDRFSAKVASFQRTGGFGAASSPESSSVSPGKSFVGELASSRRKQKRNAGRFSMQQRSHLENFKIQSSPGKISE